MNFLLVLLLNSIIIFVKMIKNETYRTILRNNSTKSLNKAKFESNSRLNLPPKAKDESNHYEITTNIAHYFSHKEESKKEENYLRRIKLLEAELKKKLLDDVILKNLFKTKTPIELTHIDLFLQFRKMQQSFNDEVKATTQLNNRVQELSKTLQKQQQLHIEHIQILGRQLQQKELQWMSHKKQLQKQNLRVRDQCENYKFLVQQIKKRYDDMNKKYKDVCEELEIQKSAKIFEEISLKEQYQGQINQLLQKMQTQKTQNHILKESLELKFQQNDKLNQQIQHVKDQKEKMELRMKEIQEISNDMNIRVKQEKQIYNHNFKSLQQIYELKIETLFKAHNQQIIKYQSKYSIIRQQLDQAIRQNKLLVDKQKEDQSSRKVLLIKNKDLSEKLNILEKEISNIEKKSVKLSIELMQLRFQKDQQSKRFDRERLQFEEKQNIMKNLQNKRSTQTKNSSDFKSEVQKKYFRS